MRKMNAGTGRFRAVFVNERIVRKLVPQKGSAIPGAAGSGARGAWRVNRM
jgi:hypothetical protein